MTSTETNDADADAESDEEPPQSQGFLSRRTLIRLLVGLGVGIPIAIEGITFVGLIRTRLFGDEGDGGDGGSGTATPTETPRPTIPPGGVGVGDELVPETRQVDRVTEAVLIPGGDSWTFSMSVQVENTGSETYQLLLGSIETGEGGRIQGSNPTTGQIEPGSTGSVTGVWEVPPEATIATVQAVAVRSFEGETETIAPRVPLADVSVRDGATTAG